MALGSVYRNAKGAQIIAAEKLTIHPKYFTSGGRNDIAVVKLTTIVRLGR